MQCNFNSSLCKNYLDDDPQLKFFEMIPKRVVKKIYPQKMLIILGKFFSPLSPIYCMILALTCIYNSDLIKLVHRFSSKVSISLTATRDVTFDYFKTCPKGSSQFFCLKSKNEKSKKENSLIFILILD